MYQNIKKPLALSESVCAAVACYSCNPRTGPHPPVPHHGQRRSAAPSRIRIASSDWATLFTELAATLASFTLTEMIVRLVNIGTLLASAMACLGYGYRHSVIRKLHSPPTVTT